MSINDTSEKRSAVDSATGGIGRSVNIVAITAQIEKLRNIDLVAVCKTLGQKAYALHIPHETLERKYAEIAHLDSEIANKNQPKVQGGSVFDRAKALASSVVNKAHTTMLDIRRNSSINELGCLVMQANIIDDRIAAEQQQVNDIQQRINGLTSDRDQLLRISIKIMSPNEDRFGARTINEQTVEINDLTPASFTALSSHLPMPADVVSWRSVERCVELLWMCDGIPYIAVIECVSSTIAERIAAIFQTDRKTDVPPADLSVMGVFLWTAPDQQPCKVTLIAQTSGITVYGAEPGEPPYTWASVFPKITLLSRKQGDMKCLRLDSEKATCILERVPVLDHLIKTSDGARNCWTLDGQDPDRLVLAGVYSDCLRLDGTQEYHPGGQTYFKTMPMPDGLMRMEFATAADATDKRVLLAPMALGYALWSAWEAIITEQVVSKAQISDLYRMFNAEKKSTLLYLLYSEIMSLNRGMESGIGMSAMISKLEAIGPVDFAENKNMRELTIAKVLLLFESIPLIKQTFEMLVTLYPYYWAQLEAEWLSKVYGNKLPGEIVRTERKRLVPLVRRDIRNFQSMIQRPLGEIESGIRPLEAILSREEIQKHWSSKVRRYTPIAAQVTSLAVVGAIMATSVATGGAALPALAFAGLGSAVLSQGLGSILGHFQKNKEDAAMIRRVASVIFPWWTVFLQTITVAIFESSEFIDEENRRAMARDRKIFDALTPEDQNSIGPHLAACLRARIVKERQKYFTEVLKGAGIRFRDIMDDMQQASGPAMHKAINGFTEDYVTLPVATDEEEAQS